MEKTKIVKNITERDLTVIGVGIVKAGETAKVPVTFHNVNFKVAKEIKNTNQK